IHVFGTAFGGRQDGTGYDPAYTSLVGIDFTYGVTTLAPGDDDLLITTVDSLSFGTITWLATNEQISIWNHNNSEGYSFRFGDGPENLGHRGVPGISGWGWLEHTMPGTYTTASDWLFTSERTPAPSALAVIGLGLLLGRVRHRR
ncbi:MAG: hypothetical protein ACYS0D_10090, partial [Planctomycetota bacterium]